MATKTITRPVGRPRKLTALQEHDLYRSFNAKKNPARTIDLASKYGVTQKTVYNILHRRASAMASKTSK